MLFVHVGLDFLEGAGEPFQWRHAEVVAADEEGVEHGVVFGPSMRTWPHKVSTPLRMSVGCCAITTRLLSFRLDIAFAVFYGKGHNK